MIIGTQFCIAARITEGLAERYLKQPFNRAINPEALRKELLQAFAAADLHPNDETLDYFVSHFRETLRMRRLIAATESAKTVFGV